MARSGGMVIDVLTAPSEDELEDEPVAEESSRGRDPEAIIASIEAQLAQLRAAVAGL